MKTYNTLLFIFYINFIWNFFLTCLFWTSRAVQTNDIPTISRNSLKTDSRVGIEILDSKSCTHASLPSFYSSDTKERVHRRLSSDLLRRCAFESWRKCGGSARHIHTECVTMDASVHFLAHSYANEERAARRKQPTIHPWMRDRAGR